MTDTVMIALIAAGGVVLGGVLGSLAQVFGPAWHERRRLDKEDARRQTELERTQVDARYAAATAFLEAVARLHRSAASSEFRDAHVARIRFLGSLRVEQRDRALEDFTSDLLREAETKQIDVQGTVDVAANLLFAWLAGHLTSDKLVVRTGRRYAGSLGNVPREPQ